MVGDELIPAVSRLLTSKNQRVSDLDEMQEQRISFAYGNGNIDGDGFSRATMSVVAPAINDVGGTNIGATFTPNSVIHRHEAEGAVRQFDVTLDLVQRFTEPGAPKFTLDPSIIEVLHSALLTRGEPSGIRTEEVTIQGSSFGPPAPNLLRDELDSMCDAINSAWTTVDALELAAFSLWRLNWIHPFVDGNGRTARALSYLILSIRIGGIIPGIPTIPEQLLHRRAEYLDALAKADITSKSGHVDLTDLRDLIGSMLQRQLEAFPAFAVDELHQIDDIVERRLRGVRNAVASALFGDDVTKRLWTIDDYVVLQLGPKVEIANAERRHRENGNAFPRLLAAHLSRAAVHVNAQQRGIILRDHFSLLSEQLALGLERNAAVTVENPVVQWEHASTAQGWSAVGALYIIRFGRELTSSTAGDVFDLLLTRHLASLKS